MNDTTANGTTLTSAHNDSPARALILGGGGAVGVGWQTGLRAAGVGLAVPKTVAGTTAGALAGSVARMDTVASTV